MNRLLPLLLLALAAPLMAAEAVDETKPAAADGFVRVSVFRGEVSIEGWERDAIRVRGELDEKTREFLFDVDQRDAVIEVRLPRELESWSGGGGSDLSIMVPHGSRLDVSAGSARVRAAGIAGGTDVAGVSGDITLRDLQNRLNVTTVSGRVEMAGVHGRSSVKSVSGDIDVTEGTGEFALNTVSGDILARGIEGEIELESVSGDMEVLNSSSLRLEGQSVSGDVDINGGLQDGGILEFDTVSGSVRVTFDAGIDARFDLKTGSGSIRNRLTDHRPESSKYVRDETLRFVSGRGTGEVIIHTRSGDIVISD